MSKNNQDNNNKTEKPPKRFKFYLGNRQRYISFSSDFDSGNIACVRQISQFQYRLASVHDGTYTDNYVNSKSWFHFSVVGFPKNTKGTFLITKVQTLSSIYYSKYSKSYRPVYKVGKEGEWFHLPKQTPLVIRQNGQIQCVIEFLFKNQNQKVYFAFCYPYTYEQNIKYIQNLSEYLYHDDFYFHQEVITKSLEGRFIHLLTITSYDHRDKNQQTEDLFDEKLFPQNNRPFKFRKPVVFISARVHPAQTAASYTMEGVINFLTNQNDLRANLLRKMFVFMIVPMINVDGVFHGHFRMDTLGKNLNRYYVDPSFQKQPAIYAIKQLANHLCKQNRLSFYFDLHAHNAKKGCFIYGNAINDFVQQVESQVFCKLISMNNKIFQYEYCNFSEKHMNAKDRNQELTKEGCGRVVMYRLANIIHSYSVQCGIVSCIKGNVIPDPMNVDFRLSDKYLPIEEQENNNSPMYKSNSDENHLFTIDMYRNLGKNIMVSILDVFDKNPYNRVYNSKFKSMDMLRRLTAFEIFHQADRFRMFEKFVFGKVKKINELIRQVLNTKLHYKQLYNFYFYDDNALKNVGWPQNIPGLFKPKHDNPLKLKRLRGNTGQLNKITDYSQSFIQTLAITKMNQTIKIGEEQDITQSKQLSNQPNNKNEFENLSSSSSQTQDLSPIKLPAEVKQYEDFIINESKQQNEMEFQHIYYDTSQIQFSPQGMKSHYELKSLPEMTQSPIKLKRIQQHQNTFEYRKSPQNSAVRVRRLLKQDIRINAKQDSRVHEEESMAQQFRKNLYQSIKQQIRQGLRKQEERRTLVNLGCTPLDEKGNRSVVSDRRKGRGKCWSFRKCENKQTNKIQLPSLGSQMFVISTSTKMINKKL